ncbi:MAG: PocR ligand-binding domain-containing protein [Planctomycetaceae bacterium]|nr:PocR ligand-binding domain-containing protein [Planctomycetaceae bacterium]
MMTDTVTAGSAELQAAQAARMAAINLMQDAMDARRKAEEAQRALRESEQRVRRKLESVLSPEGDLGLLELADIIDADALQKLMDDFYAVTHIPMSIVDLKGRLLVGVGWQDICIRFHRKHPDACQYCLESDLQLAAGVPEGQFKLYRCKNNMWDMATPIIVAGRQVGNVFCGQFFFDDETIDREAFRAQARRYGFPEEQYLAALDRVPRLSRQAVDSGMAFLLKLADMLAQLGYSNAKLARLLAERDRLTASLRESEQRVAMAKDASGLGIYDWNIPAKKIDWDSQVRSLWGVGPDIEITYDLFMSGLHPEDRAPTQDAINRAFDPSGTGQYCTEYRVISRADGVQRWVGATGQVFFEHGRAVRLIGTVGDITSRKEEEETLRAAKAAAEAAAEAKSRFLANMSHELRTPMNAILGMIELAIPKATDPTVKDCLQTAKGSAALLLTLLNDLLDSAKVESGKLELEAAPFSLRQMLDHIITVLFARADEKGLTITCDVPGNTPDALVGDRTRLQQILLNLAGNAIKFTDRGKIEIQVRLVEGEEGLLRFAVRDTGIGIPPEAVERLFQPFSQADASMTRRFGGTGLGLSISKSLVEKMGGEMYVESTPGEGSTFWFTVCLPLATEPLPPAQPAVAIPLTAAAQLRVLLVEDNAANQKLAMYVLRDRGHLVDIAGDGQEAVALTERNRYDVILMDVQMPGMDGFEATDIIRSRETDRHVPIIAMTAYAMEGDRERCLAAGMDGYLAKPIDSREMIAAVEAFAAPADAKVSAIPEATERAEPIAQPSDAVFDPASALKKCYGKPGLLSQVIDYFFDDVENLLPKLHAALRDGDRAEVGRLGHRLKGTIVHLAASRALDAARQVEMIGLPGGEQLNAETAVETLDRECQTLKKALEQHQAALRAQDPQVVLPSA